MAKTVKKIKVNLKEEVAQEEPPVPQEAPPEEVVEAKEAELVVPEKTTTAVAKPLEIDPEIAEHIAEARETLESFDDFKLPTMSLKKEGFHIREGEDPVEEFTGIIVFTKMSNIFYKKPYKAGQTELPDCRSANGKFPDEDVTDPVNKDCGICPHNKFGSAPDEVGKLCKNTRPTFILVDNPDSDTLPIIPRILRIPPTSLKFIRKFMGDIATDYGSYFSVKTKFRAYKVDDAQEYFNIKFTVTKRLTKQEKVNVKAVRDNWLSYMQQGLFGVDIDPVNVTSTGGEKDVTNSVKVEDPTSGEVEF